MRRLPLSQEQEDLVSAYETDLLVTGLGTSAHELVWGARVFCCRFGDGARWAELPLEAQLSQNVKVHRFVTWLAATGRVCMSPEYLIARRTHLGPVLARQVPHFHANFVETARQIGFCEAAVRRQWSVLGQACAVTGVAPEQLSHALLDEARSQLLDAAQRLSLGIRRQMSTTMFNLEATMFHAGVSDELPRRRTPTKASVRAAQWGSLPVLLATTMRRYLDQLSVSLRPGTVQNTEAALLEFAGFACASGPSVRSVADLDRKHIEAYKLWLIERSAARGGPLHRHTVRDRLGKLRAFFSRIIEWGYEDAPDRVPVFVSDFPIPDEALPRFLDDAASAKLLQAARIAADPFDRLCVEFLARTGLRKGEFLGLTVDAVVQIGSAFWLRVPVGKLHNDRYIPLHPHLKDLLDDWLERRPDGLRSQLLFIDRGRPIAESRVDRAVGKAAAAAGIGHASPHQLRHTLATQAINRGMSIEAIAALLGHKSLRMTMVYARIADRTVADEYFAVSEKVEALYDQPRQLPSSAEGKEMSRLRREVNKRMLGNGYCARPVEMDCHFESICESCSFFVTTVEFRPTLERQRDDAAARGQVGRQHIFEGLIARLEASEAS